MSASHQFSFQHTYQGGGTSLTNWTARARPNSTKRHIRNEPGRTGYRRGDCSGSQLDRARMSRFGEKHSAAGEGHGPRLGIKGEDGIGAETSQCEIRKLQLRSGLGTGPDDVFIADDSAL